MRRLLAFLKRNYFKKEKDYLFREIKKIENSKLYKQFFERIQSYIDDCLTLDDYICKPTFSDISSLTAPNFLIIESKQTEKKESPKKIYYFDFISSLLISLNKENEIYEDFNILKKCLAVFKITKKEKYMLLKKLYFLKRVIIINYILFDLKS